MENLIVIILICAFVSLLLNIALKKLQVESVIGYILTGMAVGYAFDLEHNASLGVIAEFGIVFLMFTIGLEFSPKKLRLMKKEVFIYGPLQMLITAGVFFVVGHWVFEFRPAVNLIVSLALSLSSTAIVLNLLTKGRKLGQRYGRNSVGVLLFQDIAVIPLLLMVSILASSHESISGLLFDVLIDGAVVFLLLFLGGRILTPHIMGQVIGTRSSELFVGAILLFVVGAAQLAHGLGFSYSLGAFLAGMVISETQYKHQVEADLVPFRDLLLGVFFITVGMQVNPLFVVDNLVVILAITVGLLVIKMLVLFGLMRVFNSSRSSLKAALLLSQCGEFSFVVFETAQINNLFLEPELGQFVIMAIVLTMMMTPFLFRYLDPITDRLIRPVSVGSAVEEDTPEYTSARQVVICGFGVLGQRVADYLEQAGVAYVGLEYDGDSFRKSKDKGLPMVFGNAAQRQLLERINIDEALAVVVAMSNEQRIQLVAETVLSVAPGVPVIVCTSNQQLKEQLHQAGVAAPIDSLEQNARALAQAVLAADKSPQNMTS